MAKSRGSRAANGESKESGKVAAKKAKAGTSVKKKKAKGAQSPLRSRAPRRSPLERAQQLIYDAFEVDDPNRQIKLAQRALQESRDCADAYTLLSEYAPDARHALMLCAEAVAAAERTLGPDTLQSEVGNFWGLLETRPYMRALLALAQQLWTSGRREESIEHLQELLRLNPDDNQGVRYTLAARLLEEGRDTDLAPLLERYNEPSTFWMFSKALAAFRAGGDCESACDLLLKARKLNKYVVPRLLNRSAFPPTNAGSYSAGSRDEAEIYVDDFSGGWRQSPGAITWLRGLEASQTRRKRKPVAATGPTPAVKKRLLQLPQRFGTEWQASVSRLPTWVEEDGAPQRPWSILIVDNSQKLVVGQDMITARPTAEQIFDQLVQAMEQPLAGEPHRPSEIQVLDEPAWETICPHLEEIGVDCIRRTELDEINYIHGQMQAMFLGEGQFVGLVETSKIELPHVAGLFAAADIFYRKAPWRRLQVETAIRVECPQFQKHRHDPWYAVVMGQNNLTIGLALYENLEALHELWWGDMPPELAGAVQNTLSVLFNESFEIPLADLLACEKHGWPVAGPEAYPSLICASVGMEPRTPKPWEVQLMEGCLRAIPDFVERHDLWDAPAAETIVVPSSAGKLELKLSWSPDADACGGDCEDCHEDCADHCDH